MSKSSSYEDYRSNPYYYRVGYLQYFPFVSLSNVGLSIRELDEEQRMFCLEQYVIHRDTKLIDGLAPHMVANRISVDKKEM